MDPCSHSFITENFLVFGEGKFRSIPPIPTERTTNKYLLEDPV